MKPLRGLLPRRYPGAVRFALALTLSPDMAEDIAQDAFVRLAPRFETLDNPAAYLRVTTVNLVREGHRRRQREQHHRRRIDPPAPDVPAVTGELFDVLARLPQRHRSVLVLRYWADWTEVEIAAALGRRPGTVKTLASRGLARLRKELT